MLLDSARKLKLKAHEKAVYVCAEGPRFETKAEIKAYQILGGDLVGMTQVPEVVLANQLGIRYAALAIITNYAAGMQDKISGEEVSKMMKQKAAEIIKLFSATISNM